MDIAAFAIALIVIIITLHHLRLGSRVFRYGLTFVLMGLMPFILLAAFWLWADAPMPAKHDHGMAQRQMGLAERPWMTDHAPQHTARDLIDAADPRRYLTVPGPDDHLMPDPSPSSRQARDARADFNLRDDFDPRDEVDAALDAPADELPLMAPPPAGWSRDVDRQLLADVYPAQSDAVRALGAWALRQLESLGARADDPWVIQIKADPEQPGARAYALNVVLKDAIATDMPTAWRVALTDAPQAPETNALHATLRLDGDAAGPTPDAFVNPPAAGLVRLVLSEGEQSTAQAAGFVEKPWVQRFDVFTQSHRDAVYAAGWSDELAASEADAQRSAYEGLTANIAAMVDHRLPRDLAPRGSRTRMQTIQAVVHDWLRRQPQAAEVMRDERTLHSTGLIDQFTQHFERPYGRVHRTAMLARLDFHAFDELLEASEDHLQPMQLTWAGRFASFLGLVIAIAVTAALLKPVVRGYHQRSRVAAAGVIAIVLVAALALATIA